MGGNLSNWEPKLKVIKKDEKGNYHIGRWTISASAAALVLSVLLAVGQWYNTYHGGDIPLPKPKPTQVSTVQDNRSDALLSSFDASEVKADLVVPSNNVDVYKLVRIRSQKTADFYDLLVMTITGGNINFIETVNTSNPGEWVFTGPPGQYSIRLTSFDIASGFTSVTGTVTIGGVPPAPGPGPGPNPNPNPTPGPGPVVPVGKYGYGPEMVKVINEKVAKEYWSYAAALADNFESIASAQAAGSYDTPNAMNTELAGKNRFTLSITSNDTATWPPQAKAWLPFFEAWTAKTNQLIKDKQLPNIAADYSVAYKETMTALRSFK